MKQSKSDKAFDAACNLWSNLYNEACKTMSAGDAYLKTEETFTKVYMDALKSKK